MDAEPVTLRANSTNKVLPVSLGALSTCAVPYAAIKIVMITSLKNDTQRKAPSLGLVDQEWSKRHGTENYHRPRSL